MKLSKYADKDFYRKIMQLALPIIFQNLINTAVNSADVLMLGFVNQTSLSASSLANQISFVLNLFYSGVASGTIMLCAQYWGRQQLRTIEKIMGIAMRLSMSISILFGAAACLVPGLLMRIFTADQEMIAVGSSYLRILGLSYLFMGFSQVYLCVMRSIERVVFSAVVTAIALISNILLNAVFIFGLFGVPAFGIRGAAIATVIARGMEFFICVGDNFHGQSVRFRIREVFASNSLLFHDYLHYSLPAFGNEVVWGVGFSMYSVIMGHLGSDAVAASSIANIVKNIIACMCLGIGTGSGILVGNELGRGALDRAREYGGRLCRIAVAAGAVSGAVLLVCSPLVQLLAVSLSEQAHEYLRVMLMICAYYMVGKAVNSTVVAGIFCAGGDTKFGLLCDAVTMWVIIVPVGMLAAFVWKLPVLTVYFLLNLDEFVKLPAVYRHYKKYLWVRNLTKESGEQDSAPEMEKEQV